MFDRRLFLTGTIEMADPQRVRHAESGYLFSLVPTDVDGWFMDASLLSPFVARLFKALKRSRAIDRDYFGFETSR